MSNQSQDILITRLSELELSYKDDLYPKITQVENNKATVIIYSKLYYDETRDTEMKNRYYYPIQKKKKAGNLFYSFHELLKKTHDPIPYFVSKDKYLYSWVDMQPDGSIKNIYSGINQDPKELIKKDYDTIQKKYYEFENLLKSNHDLMDTKKNKISKIDYELKFNTEHIVPQSWYGAVEPMKGDLHHLFACQPECNIKRSNFPYSDFSFYIPESTDEKIQNQCGVVYNGKFEPEYGKGTIARAMLYFLVRYPRTIKKSILPFIDLSLLLRWHEEFEVTTYEKHRNYAIYLIQGNRNPFIDFPELAREMDFRLAPVK